MTTPMRIRIAALATAIFIGGLSIAGIAARHQSPPAAKPAQAQSQAAPAASTFGDEELEADEE